MKSAFVKMGIYEYLALTEEEQWDILWDRGVFLEHYVTPVVKFSLYAIDGFFVEVELENDKVKGKAVFKQGDRLEKYTLDFDIGIGN
ncbi:hypothetical protein FGF1_03190 [Flavobacteriaceae bacterium GF1]